MRKIDLPSRSFPLTSIMENSQDVWGIKDRDSRFIYANRAFFDFLNLPQGFDVIGRRDDELPTCITEFALIIQKLGKEVIKSGQKITLIKTHFFGREQKLQPYLYETFPLHNKRNKCIGTVFYGRKLAIVSLPHYIDKLTATLLFEPPSNLFTQSELRIIFYLLRTMSAKEIGKTLARSHRTIENRIRIIYQKAKVHSFRDFKHFCHKTGFDRTIPHAFIRPGIQFIE
ncbi:PAS domain-containing protein [Candidatus Fukatsuia symbiotica]|uniref:Transcriptional regulator n=1 Tax=Candidatus Fukatsuia symbiotica TaxID=1878942 RepID=A0A2U8I522_9GAMM|nr:PAS domain-containing protein [Candidatus Fukatsuia symbiotica]AWK13285.1 transcriptional regulator [Candidatus Fukatsuia symbiotica]MEA9444159.1 PAS domain-containing protein [Candidatus Fukatsuia symbiotica]